MLLSLNEFAHALSCSCIFLKHIYMRNVDGVTSKHASTATEFCAETSTVKKCLNKKIDFKNEM